MQECWLFNRHGTPLDIRQPIEQVQFYTEPVDCQE